MSKTQIGITFLTYFFYIEYMLQDYILDPFSQLDGSDIDG